MDLTIAPALQPVVRLGLVALEGLVVRESDEALAREVDGYCAELRAKFGDGKSAEVPGAADARSLYKALGLDPTKTRPSNEALLRRALKGEPLFRINTLVDALNLASLRFQLPFGLYDLAKVVPPVVLRKGEAGESYEGIRKGPVHVDGRPVLVDAQGAFGNPTSDSARTMITTNTTRALVVVYAPASHTAARLTSVMDGTASVLLRYSGGQESGRRTIP